MVNPLSPFRSLVAVMCVGLAGCASSNVPAGEWHFDEFEIGMLPWGWSVGETNAGAATATWYVFDEGGNHAIRVASKNSGQTYNLLLAPGKFAPDVDLHVRLRADTGQEDQGGGLVWRAKDASSYYVTRWNPLEDNLRVYKVVDGVRTQLASADVKVEPTWHALSVLARGTSIEIEFDGRRVLQVEDATFSGGGMVGFWTKADASSLFDDFIVSEVRH
ncbi:MAG: hypothetical protein H6832_12350 [Planctomycetes bacterium]|nr:hypothetical protein [Planctomycetota bacterium]MCB9919183.1 hypothetical protein [Planctomycetota bacterium]